MTGVNRNQAMQEAMRLMQTGDLLAATQAIQRGLHGGQNEPAPPSASSHRDGQAEQFIEGCFRHVPDSTGASPHAPESEDQHRPDPRGQDDGEFRLHRFICDAGAMDYKLFVPSGLDAAPAPVIVMLHGCTQSVDDFALGTRMNGLAQEHGYVIAYPIQPQSKNASKCWNWFRSQDQRRGQGEPGVIAALARDLVQRHGFDARRVYVAGLSAGGAMAAVLGATYPDVFAAIGVHSGLPFGIASDLPSAFAAMKQGGRGTQRSLSPALTDPVPAIVFHGDRDTTVHCGNGAAVIAQCTGLDASPSHRQTTVERGAVPNGRSYTRTMFRDPTGMVVAEQWVVHGAGHAWSGGHPAGSYTDPRGPDASEQMVRFFSSHRREPRN